MANLKKGKTSTGETMDKKLEELFIKWLQYWHLDRELTWDEQIDRDNIKDWLLFNL